MPDRRDGVPSGFPGTVNGETSSYVLTVFLISLAVLFRMAVVNRGRRHRLSRKEEK